jgi:hypothetical protein
MIRHFQARMRYGVVVRDVKVGLCVRERDKRLELVTARFALPQVLYAVPVQIP